MTKNIDTSANFLMVSVPGMGVSHYVKRLMERETKPDLAYINKAGQKLSGYNVLDLDFDKNEQALDAAVEYLKGADVNQKFAVAVNTPFLLESEQYRKSYLASHIYGLYFFSARSREEVGVFVGDMDPSIGEAQVDKIYALSGGIGRFIKFFVFHLDLLDKPVSRILGEADLQGVCLPTIRVVEQCKEEDLARLGLKRGGKWVSEVLGEHFARNPAAGRFDIAVNDDLSVSEEGQVTSELSKFEADVLKMLLGGGGVVTKEQVAEVKWGKDSYDKFSDQAINKAMRRLDEKLIKYRIRAIPRHGFKLERD